MKTFFVPAVLRKLFSSRERNEITPELKRALAEYQPILPQLTGEGVVPDLIKIVNETCEKFNITVTDITYQAQEGAQALGQYLFQQQHLPIEEVTNTLNYYELRNFVKCMDYEICSKRDFILGRKS